MESCFGTIKTELVHQACYPTREAAGMTCSLTSKDITIVSGYIPPRVYHSRTGRAPSRLIRCPLNQGKVGFVVIRTNLSHWLQRRHDNRAPYALSPYAAPDFPSLPLQNAA